MRIGLVTNYYPPEVGSNSYLYQSLAHHLGARGHEVFVITGHPRYHVPDGVQAKVPVEREAPNVMVHRARVPHAAKKGIAVRALNETALPVGLLGALRRCLPLDAILMYSPPLTLGLLGMAARKLWGVPFVFNVQDMLPQAAIDMGALRNPLLINAARRLEGAIYRSAAVLLVHSEGNREIVRRYHPRLTTPVAAVHNWVDFAQFEGLSPLPTEMLQFIQGRTVFSYGGALGLQHDISTILDAAAQLRGRPDIGFVVAGDGARAGHWRQQVQERGLTNVRVDGLMPQKQFNSLLVRSRASFLALSPMLKTPVVPGKLQTIMAAGIPAICVVNATSDATRIVSEAGCGYVVPPGEAGLLTRLIVQLADDGERARQMGAAGRTYARAHFAKENCMAAVERLLLAASGNKQAQEEAACSAF
jgi:colanic acid biosynthesis glycosyl transferase WcaI